MFFPYNPARYFLIPFSGKLLICLLTALLAAALSVPAWSAPREDIPKSLRKTLKQLGFPRKGVSLYVQAVDAGEPLLAVADGVSRNPASVIKLLTTAAALERLGPAYTWKTEVYADGSLSGGTLSGDLYVKGYGDPYMVPEFFWRFLRELRHVGLRDIHGDLVLDYSYFRPEPEDPAEFDGQPYRTYNVSPNALLVNFQSMRFTFAPQGRGVSIAAFPQPETVKIENKVRLVGGRCGYWKTRIGMDLENVGPNMKLRFWGRYARSCGERHMYRAVTNSSSYLEGLFRRIWEEQGGGLKGRFRHGRAPEKADLIYTANSKPLAELIRGINKFSNNVMTRQLLLTMGAEFYEPPGTHAKGAQVVKDFLKQHGIATRGLVLDNGAGLSRRTRVSARQLGQVLKLVYQKPYMPEFISSLPISAVDGTMRSRFVDSDMAGRMHIKTGSLDHVRSIAGYVLNRKGKRFVVVLLHNHRRAHKYKGIQFQDAVLDWVYHNT